MNDLTGFLGPMAIGVVVLAGGVVGLVLLLRRTNPVNANLAPVSGKQPIVAVPGISIRHYRSVNDFQADAAVMAGAGWMPVMQTETTGGVNGSAVALAVIGVAVGLLFHWVGWIIAIVGLILAVVQRGKSLVVTYRPDAATPPVAEATGDVVAEPA